MKAIAKQTIRELTHLGFEELWINGKGEHVFAHPGDSNQTKIKVSPSLREVASRKLLDRVRGMLGEQDRPNKRSVAAVRQRAAQERSRTKDVRAAAAIRRSDLRRTKVETDRSSDASNAAITITSRYDAHVGDWALTTHAVARMLAHRIHADDVLDALTHPVDMSLGGDQPVYIGRKCSVAANPRAHVIVTVIRTETSAKVA